MSGITIYEVAQYAGVSRSTVSRVLNGAKNVSPQSRMAVETAIDDLKYFPSQAARSLVTKQAHVIGLIIPEELDRFFLDPFFAELLTGVTQQISDSEYALNLMVASGDPKERNVNKVVNFVTNGGVDGVILVGHRVGDTLIHKLINKVPIVFGGREEPHDEKANTYCVDADNYMGGYLAGQHLLDTGRTKIATITGPHDMASAKDRHQGFMAALAERHTVPVSVQEGDYSPQSGYLLGTQLINSGLDFDSVFAANDLMAREILKVLHEHNRRCPEDVAVIGFDDCVVARECLPPLTTIRQPIRLQGVTMADVLLKVLRGEKPPSTIMLETHLVVRKSS